MKKVITVALVLASVLSLTACKPREMKSDTYKLIKQAISLMEDYHSGKKTPDAVEGALESIEARLRSIEKRDKGKVTGNVYAMQNDTYASCAATYVNSFLIGMKHYSSYDSFGMNDTYDKLESLKRLIK